MKLFSLHDIALEPVSHDPGLAKKVLARDPLPSIKHISHIILQPGDSASEHSHSDYVEVFYCIRGDAEFSIQGETLSIKKRAFAPCRAWRKALHSECKGRNRTPLLACDPGSENILRDLFFTVYKGGRGALGYGRPLAGGKT